MTFILLVYIYIERERETFLISFVNLQFHLSFRLIAMIYTLIFIVLLTMCAQPSASKIIIYLFNYLFFEFVLCLTYLMFQTFILALKDNGYI